jgi:hypothetical protein
MGSKESAFISSTSFEQSHAMNNEESSSRFRRQSSRREKRSRNDANDRETSYARTRRPRPQEPADDPRKASSAPTRCCLRHDAVKSGGGTYEIPQTSFVQYFWIHSANCELSSRKRANMSNSHVCFRFSRRDSGQRIGRHGPMEIPRPESKNWSPEPEATWTSRRQGRATRDPDDAGPFLDWNESDLKIRWDLKVMWFCPMLKRRCRF